MPRPSNEDLFKDSTMTFGEHLDELRTALFKSVVAISIGFVIGLAWLGNWVVQRIQDPMIIALERYYVERADEEFQERIQAMEKAGQPVPPEMRDPKYAHQLTIEDRMLFEERFLDLAQVMEELKQRFPKQLSELDVPSREAGTPPKRSDLLRVFVWYHATDDHRLSMKTFSAPESFMIKIKASLVVGIVLASPAVFYFLWSFVAAGLYPHEKKYVHIFLPFSLGLFLAGAMLAFFFVFPPMLEFFFSYNKLLKIDIEPRITEWMNLALMLPVAFGASFQLPLIMLFLERIGIFTTSTYLSSWRIAILVMAIVAMVITPTGDPGTMLMMLAPLTLLYFGGILLCKWMPKQGGSRTELSRQ